MKLSRLEKRLVGKECKNNSKRCAIRVGHILRNNSGNPSFDTRFPHPAGERARDQQTSPPPKKITNTMGFYSESSEWADIIPIPQDDGGLNPLAAIAYPDEYSEAMSYLRALMAKNEKSERALRLTVDIIGMNPAHYTVWLVFIPWRVWFCSLKGGETDEPIMGIY